MLRKAVRTAQNLFPLLQDAKNGFYHLSRRYAGAVHDPHFAIVRLLPRGPDDLFLDVGANHGQSILAIRHFRPDATIMSFEPHPLLFKRLTRRFGRMPGVSLVNVGLGAAAAELPLYVPAYGGFVYDGIASFSRDSAYNYLSPETLYFFNPARVSVAEYECRIRTLDSLDLAPSFMKIDIEGFEYDALQGAMATLRRHEPVLLVEQFWGDSRVPELLRDLGYTEIVEQGGALVPGRSDAVNAVYGTPRRIASLGALR